jgi:hypothetical protein
MKLAVALALVALPALSSCSSSFEFSEMEIDVRSLPGKNGVALLLVERGIYGRQDTAVEALRRMLEGKRVLPPEGGFISFDYEKDQTELAEKPGASLRPEDRAYLEFLQATRVQKSGLFLDERGRLCLFQLWHFAKPEYVVDWINQNTNKDLVEKGDTAKPFVPGFPYFDEASWKRAIARAREGWCWVRLEGKEILVDVPITRECAASCLRELLQQEDLRRNYGTLLGSVSSLDVEEDRTRIHFAPDASGWYRPIRTPVEGKYQDDLLEAVKASDLPMSPAPTLETMDRALRVEK